MKILTVGTVLLLAAGLQAGAQQTSPSSNAAGGGKGPEGNCGLLYGKDHALTFCAPGGWILDNGIMNDQGIYAVFYPTGSNFQDAKVSGTFMYFNVVGKAPESTVTKLMADDAKQVEHDARAALVIQADPIKIGDASIPVLRFAPGAFDRYEAVAYIGEEKVLIMVVISSKNEDLFKKDYPAFVLLVQSYKWLSSNVTIQHK
ncbi:MAG: hypothetical protein P4K93_12310 [Terracidiphilus sp.]|nr:hypothetical protein [Terracidiphilus sp.]MDR3798935.1 hypothetical protein [Terracidiphilus sp.]